MAISAFIPIKNFEISKERLSNILSSSERSNLAKRMARHTVNTLVDSDICDSIFIVTNDKELMFDEAKSFYTSSPLNSALNEAIRSHNKNEIILIMHADLPRINELDLHLLKNKFSNQKVSIVSDLLKNGTNCLMYEASQNFELKFGLNSYNLFTEEFKKNNISFQDINLSTLQDDLDSEEDYFKLVKHING